MSRKMNDGALSEPPKVLRGAKYQAVSEELRRRIKSGKYGVGQRVPSIRELSQEFQVSSVTVTRSIQELVTEELVTCGAGSRGTVVLRQDKLSSEVAQRTTLACLFRPHRPRNEVDNFGLDVLQGIRQQISAHDYRFVYHCFDEIDYQRKMLVTAFSPWIAGMVLDVYTPTDFLHRLAEKKIPMVLFGRVEVMDGLSCVAPDYERCGRESFRILAEKGYERFGFYGPPLPEDAGAAHIYPLDSFHRGFKSAADAAGVPADRLVCFLENNVTEGKVLLDPEDFGLPRAKDSSWRRLGVFCSTDTRGRRFMDAVAKTDLRVGQDVGLIGYGNLECNLRGRPPFDTWHSDRLGVGIEIVNELMARIENPLRPAAIIKMSPQYVDRGSV